MKHGYFLADARYSREETVVTRDQVVKVRGQVGVWCKENGHRGDVARELLEMLGIQR